ncbi:hypothetical protein BDF22DRAFT_743594 [Syncephalis plumigaleata]|nr:hypothetical protein BDF22DRAFT_743594 [Syncephalis plumigaleata]
MELEMTKKSWQSIFNLLETIIHWDSLPFDTPYQLLHSDELFDTEQFNQILDVVLLHSAPAVDTIDIIGHVLDLVSRSAHYYANVPRPYVLEADHASSLTTDHTISGTTVKVKPVAREYAATACFSRLFAFCSSDTRYEQIIIQGALSHAAISQLLQRCRFIMEAYLADAQLRGGYPFSRIRTNELTFILHQLLELQLHDQAVLKLCSQETDTTTSTTNSGKSSHIVALYPLLCRLSAVTDSKVAKLARQTLSRIGGDIHELFKLTIGS